MVYVVRRKSDDFYFTKDGKWVENIDRNCWLNKEQITKFKSDNSYLVYTVLNPKDRNNS